MKDITARFINESVKFNTTYEEDSIDDIMILHTIFNIPTVKKAIDEWLKDTRHGESSEIEEDVNDLIERVQKYCKEHKCEDWTY